MGLTFDMNIISCTWVCVGVCVGACNFLQEYFHTTRINDISYK